MHFSFAQPLSEDHKKYIENLNIEKDAQMLRDVLNICEEAVDYFRASSALLKAGVKAGLSLYDIAILCCRNDNLAEVPSMMEKLFDMASDLAHAAVENERWDHRAASRAIVEQLTPHRRSTQMESRFLPGFLFHKSVSSGAFSSTPSPERDNASRFLQDEEGMVSPGIALSSASDSSSEPGDMTTLETDPCEEWAANVIADISEEQIATCRPRRSHSIISDDESNDSGSVHKGFWRVAPGSSPPVHDFDDGSLTWSPHISPRNSLHEAIRVSELDDCVIPAAATSKAATVKFAPMIPAPPGPFIPPATVSIASKPDNLLWKPEGGGMTRSKSYSSLPRRGSKPGMGHQRKVLKPLTEDYENYRKYFHKFIDLVIVRETTAALNQRVSVMT